MGLFFVIVALFFIANIRKNKAFLPTFVNLAMPYFNKLLRNNKLWMNVSRFKIFINKTY